MTHYVPVGTTACTQVEPRGAHAQQAGTIPPLNFEVTRRDTLLLEALPMALQTKPRGQCGILPTCN